MRFKYLENNEMWIKDPVKCGAKYKFYCIQAIENMLNCWLKFFLYFIFLITRDFEKV